MQLIAQIGLGVLAAFFAAVLAVIYATLPWTMSYLAKRQVLVAFCPEGAIKSVVRGGNIQHQFMAMKGWHLNDPRKQWFKPTDTDGKKIPEWQRLRNERPDSYYDDRPWFMKVAGVYWIGWPPFSKVYWYEFSWSEARLNAQGVEEIWHRKERTDFIYAKSFNYVRSLKAVENKDGLPLDVDYVLTIEIYNAFVALFRNEDWLTIVSASTNREARNFVGAHRFKDLLSENAEHDDTVGQSGNFSLPIVALTYNLPDDDPATEDCGLLARTGALIKTADLQSLEPSGDDRNRIRDATTELFVQQQKAAGIEAVGTADANVIWLRGEKEAEVIERKGSAHAKALTSRLQALSGAGKLGELMLQTDAMMADGPGKRVIWANNPFIRDSGLSEILEASGFKTAQELKDALARFGQQNSGSAAA